MTILGQHTVAETRDLLNRTAYVVNVLQAAWERFAPAWVPRPGASYMTQDGRTPRERWLADWVTFRDRLDAVHARAKLIALQSLKPGVPASLIDAEKVYADLMRAITKSGAGDYVTGDLPDLRERLSAALAEYNYPPLDFSAMPGSDAADVDFIAYTNVDGSIKPIRELGGAIVATAKDAATSSTASWLFGGALLAGALYAGITFGPALYARARK